MDPDLVHPKRGEVSARAIAVCSVCPVKVPCRNMGLEDQSLQGVWGGLSVRDRRVYRSVRRVS